MRTAKPKQLALKSKAVNQARFTAFCAWFLRLEFIRRIAGEVCDHTVRIIQIEHLKDGVGSFAVLALYDGVLDAELLDCHIVLKHSLAAQLRDMEEKKLLSRQVYAEVPPRVEYTLTDTGYSLKPILDAMSAWGKEYKEKNQ